MTFFKSLSAKLAHVLLLNGGWGLLVMSFLDSSFIPFPVVNDVALIMLASQRPSHAALYALQSTLGSLLGVYVLYALARGGGKVLWKKSTPASVARAQRWLERNDFVALLVVSLLPPPAPLKVFVLAAGVLRVDAVHFGAALVIGRGLRFAADAWLGAHYGAQAEHYLRRNLGKTSFVVIALILMFTLVYRRARQRAKKDGPPISRG